MRCGNGIQKIPDKQTSRNRSFTAIPRNKTSCRGDGAEQAAGSSARLLPLSAACYTIGVGLPPGTRQTGPGVLVGVAARRKVVGPSAWGAW